MSGLPALPGLTARTSGAAGTAYVVGVGMGVAVAVGVGVGVTTRWAATDWATGSGTDSEKDSASPCPGSR